MGHFRFWRRIKVAPGVSVNLSKSGASLSVGPRGAKVTMGRRGVRQTVGLPGTGLYYTVPASSGGASRKRSKAQEGGPMPRVPAASRLQLGFFKRLVTPASEQSFVEGCKALALGDSMTAVEHLEDASPSHPDGAFLAGVVRLQREEHALAELHLERALQGERKLGRLLDKYGIEASVAIPIASGVSAVIGPRPRGIRLALAEAHQALERWDLVVSDLAALQKSMPDDVVIRLSLAEILLEARADDEGAMRAVVRLGQGVENVSPVHTALLLQKARALRRLGMLTAARELLTSALRRRKDRPPELLHTLRYERAAIYEQMGRRAQARSDLERIFADDPDFEDVSSLLNAA